jgi:hypothetical protein
MARSTGRGNLSVADGYCPSRGDTLKRRGSGAGRMDVIQFLKLLPLLVLVVLVLGVVVLALIGAIRDR